MTPYPTAPNVDSAAPGGPDRLRLNIHPTDSLLSLGHDQLDRFDLDGLRATIVQLRRRAACQAASAARLHADLFETLLALHLVDSKAAKVHLQAAEQASSISDDDAARAMLALVKARMQLIDGQPADAASSLESGWPLAEHSGNLRLQVMYAHWLSVCFSTLKRVDAAKYWLDRALQGAIDGGFQQLQLLCVSRLAFEHTVLSSEAAAAGDPITAKRELALAREYYDGAEPLLKLPETPLHRRVGMQIDRSLMQQYQGQAHLPEALAGLDECDRQLNQSPNVELQIRCALMRAYMLLKLGELENAERVCVSALTLDEDANDLRYLGHLLGLAAEIAEKSGKLSVALDYLKRLLAHRDRLAADTASERAAAVAIRLQTLQAQVQAGTEQVRSSALTDDNAALRARAAAFERDAQQDPLTGAANRRRFDAHLATAHATAAARQVPLCLAMLDIDHFKRVNDMHGHPVGDLVLQRFVQVVQAQCREGDLLARLGGEEFALVFSAVGLGPAQAVCERIRQAVQDSPWHDIAPGLAVTISIGLADAAVLPGPAEGLAAADALLYQAKSNGRSRVASLAAAGP